jgi:hypothetical protein
MLVPASCYEGNTANCKTTNGGNTAKPGPFIEGDSPTWGLPSKAMSLRGCKPKQTHGAITNILSTVVARTAILLSTIPPFQQIASAEPTFAFVERLVASQ